MGLADTKGAHSLMPLSSDSFIGDAAEHIDEVLGTKALARPISAGQGHLCSLGGIKGRRRG